MRNITGIHQHSFTLWCSTSIMLVYSPWTILPLDTPNETTSTPIKILIRNDSLILFLPIWSLLSWYTLTHTFLSIIMYRIWVGIKGTETKLTGVLPKFYYFEMCSSNFLTKHFNKLTISRSELLKSIHQTQPEKYFFEIICIVDVIGNLKLDVLCNFNGQHASKIV